MTFVFGINEKDGIYAYERKFDEEGFNTMAEMVCVAEKELAEERKDDSSRD